MAHYAFLDENNLVTEVIVGVEEDDLIEGLDPELWYGNLRNQVCKRTSYNGKIRKNYAGIGFTYDANLDAFISPSPFPSWVLNQDSCQWESPIPKPTEPGIYFWNEDELDWELADFSEVEE
jgi:hypothetical protein